MKLLWTKDSVLDLTAVRDYIEVENPEIAKKVALRIISQAEGLLSHPLKGRLGRRRNTRESIVLGFPYLLVYRIVGQSVEILRVLHISRKYP